MMDYRELRKLKAQLIEKENKTEDELHLLMELQSLSKVIDTIGFSLQMSGDVSKGSTRTVCKSRICLQYH